MLSKTDGALTPKLVIDLKSSDVQENATVAFNNMFSHPNGGETSQTGRIGNNVNLLLEEGRNEMRNNFPQLLSAAAPQMDRFVDFVDGIVRVSSLFAHSIILAMPLIYLEESSLAECRLAISYCLLQGGSSSCPEEKKKSN